MNWLGDFFKSNEGSKVRIIFTTVIKESYSQTLPLINEVYILAQHFERKVTYVGFTKDLFRMIKRVFHDVTNKVYS